MLSFVPLGRSRSDPHDMLTILPPRKNNDGFSDDDMPRSFPPSYQHHILQTVGSSSLSSIDEGNTTTSTHSRRENWVFFQHFLSIADICLDRILFTFLTTATSDSSFWKFAFKRLVLLLKL